MRTDRSAPRSRVQTIRHQLLGLALLAVMAASVLLSVACYRKVFAPTLTVRLRTDNIGSNLTQYADVKLRGLIVGEVRAISTTGLSATVQLAIDPAKARYIPANSTAQLLPTSLFGRTYVALIPPVTPAGPIRDGDVLQQDTSSTAIDVEQLLADALPVLDALRPAELTVTLRSIADALDGRGAQLGSEIVRFDNLLKQFNPHLPQLLHEVVRTGAVARDWAAVAPDLLGALANAQVTAATITSQASGLARLLVSVTTAGEQLTQFVNADGSAFVGVVAANRGALDLLARYAPEYACTLEALVAASARLDKVVSAAQLHASAQIVSAPPAYTTPLRYTHGSPSCAGLSTMPASSVAAGSVAETQAVNALIAGDLHTSPEHVPAVATLLAAPLLRGTAVIVK